MSTVPKDYQALLLTTPRLRREQRTIEAMLNVWCEAHPLHVRTRHGKLCAGCEELFEYASYRLLKCPYGEEKPTCKKCPVHCYTRDMREQMHEVMRFAGPRMLLRHPVLAIRHLLDEKRDAPSPLPRTAAGTATEDHANVPVIPPVLFGVGLAAGFFLKWLVPVRLVPPSLQEPFCFAGAGLALLGLAFGGWAFATFLRARTTPHPNHPVSGLVTWGPYRVSRNPMYVGLSAGVAGIALIANTPWVLAALPPVWFALRRLVIDHEEAYLERKFGGEYRAFKARTRRWL